MCLCVCVPVCVWICVCVCILNTCMLILLGPKQMLNSFLIKLYKASPRAILMCSPIYQTSIKYGKYLWCGIAYSRAVNAHKIKINSEWCGTNWLHIGKKPGGSMAKRMALSFFFKYLFIRLLWWYMGCFSCGMWDLVPGPGIEPGHPALGACSLSHWITREVSIFFFFF